MLVGEARTINITKLAQGYETLTLDSKSAIQIFLTSGRLQQPTTITTTTTTTTTTPTTTTTRRTRTSWCFQ